MIQTILCTLFQVKTTGFQVKSGMGALGHVAAYFGMVEASTCIYCFGGCYTGPQILTDSSGV